MCKESILNKIKNLLNKTVENGCTEAEATAALATARKLMLKHKIEEKDILGNSEKEIIQVELINYNISIPWLYLLIDLFTENFGVMKYITVSGKIKHFVLFGLKEDVECVIELIKCAHDFAEEKASKYARTHRELFGNAKGIKYAWFDGFILGIEAKYKEQNVNSEYSLMVTVDKDVNELYTDFTKDFDKEETVIKRDKNDQNAMNDGYKNGKTFGTTPLESGI